jgi:hypothetical protein
MPSVLRWHAPSLEWLRAWTAACNVSLTGNAHITRYARLRLRMDKLLSQGFARALCRTWINLVQKTKALAGSPALDWQPKQPSVVHELAAAR